jgi:hypothetical protein
VNPPRTTSPQGAAHVTVQFDPSVRVATTLQEVSDAAHTYWTLTSPHTQARLDEQGVSRKARKVLSKRIWQMQQPHRKLIVRLIAAMKANVAKHLKALDQALVASMDETGVQTGVLKKIVEESSITVTPKPHHVVGDGQPPSVLLTQDEVDQITRPTIISPASFSTTSLTGERFEMTIIDDPYEDVAASDGIDP